MSNRRRAVHRTILVVDMEGFGNPCRTNVHRQILREGLYEVMQQSFVRAGIPWLACDREDRGDGIFILAPPEIPKSLFVEPLPDEIARALLAYNGEHATEERIRLRMSLHAGEITYDHFGSSGNAINLAFRLLDATSVRYALAQSPGTLAIIASAWFFDEVIRQGVDSRPLSYSQVHVEVKDVSVCAWVTTLNTRVDLPAS